ncbi:MAG TPA: SRPBCC domain-containing protein [Trinickia sp.]|uniref:CoxG family protein n=1 Tax=Trinickia sp. TaxID=2571163 RepID=UPI002CD1575F|nr:SRPBCC domain-containing protein [Trinickia sp.]HTI18957.1 SRPBCC domain-containing protein [Trinickia sp.]
MELTDALCIPLDPAVVAAAFADSALVRASLEHCESFALQPSGEYALVLTVPVGPLRARYAVRMHVTHREKEPTALGGAALCRQLEFKASAAGVGSLRGHIDIELQQDVLHGDERRDVAGYGTRIQYAIWATLDGPLAELPAGQAESALYTLVDDFFAEFSAVLLAKYGKAPNRASSGAMRRQQVFLRPIDAAGLARKGVSHDALEETARGAGDMLMGTRGAPKPDRQPVTGVPLLIWVAAVMAGVALLYLLDQINPQ